MALEEISDIERLKEYLDLTIKRNAEKHNLIGWVLAKDIQRRKLLELGDKYSPAMTQAILLESVCEQLPIFIEPGQIFAGTEEDAFSASYALINPTFRIESFEGYNDEMAFYDDVKPSGKIADIKITEQMIEDNRKFWSRHPSVVKIRDIYKETGNQTKEAVYFVERVTGHTIPDFEEALEEGLEYKITELKQQKKKFPAKSDYFNSMIKTLQAAMTLADRYSKLAGQKSKQEDNPTRKKELQLIEKTCHKVPRQGAVSLYEALQSYILLWQVMNLEQLPNPYAFSVGNLDRIMQPYYKRTKVSKKLAVQLTRHFLAFFEVGDRDWAISQNIMVGGSDVKGNDLSNDMTYIILEAYHQSNRPQPNFSVKTHLHTPFKFYRAISKFMFNFGHSSPSFLNDVALFSALKKKGIAEEDLKEYAIAGCQEPLIKGKENGNTTNSWLNLAKVLEISLNNGYSLITGEKLGPSYEELGLEKNPFTSFAETKKIYYHYLDYFIRKMVKAANECTEALSLLPVPFASFFMGGGETGSDMRDCNSSPGTKYNASGCLIHGLGTTADSLTVIKFLFDSESKLEFSLDDLIAALKRNFEGFEELRNTIQKIPKFGNNIPYADKEAIELVKIVSEKINRQKNPFGKNFAADWSSPSTNLLYGYWTGATPDGRGAREDLSFGLDPSTGMAVNGLLTRILSQSKLDYEIMTGGSAVAMSINPENIKGMNLKQKALYLRDIISAIFNYSTEGKGQGLGYVYFNVFSFAQLLDVAEHPEKYPYPVIVRIHGQYGDARKLSPDILKKDIIPRLDPGSVSF
ncbi:MAG: pyruvate formate lyase family protein [Candidatus Caldatribacteriota bacterium]|nr:pyruvate formate lyase family protein [Candidatus Caldatribacteriota bacterium]